jgi:acetate kinase
MKILVANIGSTSFKYRLFDMTSGAVLAEGRTERIGPGGLCPDYASAIEACIGALVGEGKPLASLGELAAVGFKAVHARGISGAQLVDERVLQAMKDYVFLAPAHNPPYIAAMRAFREKAPAVPAVALFETSFFDRVPEAAVTYACPYEWRTDHLVRRYGFHGASHRSAAERARELYGAAQPGSGKQEAGSRRQTALAASCLPPPGSNPPPTGLRHISCHLGGSSSIAAIRDGIAIDISFGMSPQSGLPQTNRAGDIDVFAVLYMMKQKGLGPDEMARVLAQQSGLAGLSGTSGDLRDLMEAAGAGDHRARLALDVFVYSIRHYLGAFLVQLGGLDILTFSGGIGERSGAVRAAVCQGLEAFGIELDAAQAAVSGEAKISTERSAVQVWVIPANEEWIVARAAAELLQARGAAAV